MYERVVGKIFNWKNDKWETKKGIWIPQIIYIVEWSFRFNSLWYLKKNSALHKLKYLKYLLFINNLSISLTSLSSEGQFLSFFFFLCAYAHKRNGIPLPPLDYFEIYRV